MIYSVFAIILFILLTTIIEVGFLLITRSINENKNLKWILFLRKSWWSQNSLLCCCSKNSTIYLFNTAPRISLKWKVEQIALSLARKPRAVHKPCKSHCIYSYINYVWPSNNYFILLNCYNYLIYRIWKKIKKIIMQFASDTFQIVLKIIEIRERQLDFALNTKINLERVFSGVLSELTCNQKRGT